MLVFWGVLFVLNCRSIRTTPTTALQGECVLLGMASIVLDIVKISKDTGKSLNYEYAATGISTV